MKRLFIFLLLFVNLCTFAQNSVPRPKLVVGIMVDQMRWDYLYRFNNRYSNDGWKRLLREGFSCENTFVPYVPTITAVGHTSVYTGSVPFLHGIIGNNWYDKNTGRVVYCTDDASVAGVGSNSVAGKMSPKNLWSNTITDELRMATNFQNKTIAIALKDRGAILPGGHTANAAYWFDNATGGWITSTFYRSSLPEWVKNLNAKKLPDTYLKQNWNTLYPIDTYRQSTADNKSYESNLLGEDNSFPHKTDGATDNRYELFRTTPFGNTFTVDMAKAAIEGERLGQSAFTDFLAVSFSSTDYIGHSFGPNSIEVEDAYLRLDKDLGSFLTYLDAKIGKGQYLVFLTADHAVAHVPAFVEENKMPGQIIEEASYREWLNEAIQKAFGVANVVNSVINYEVYFDDQMLEQNKLDKKIVAQFVSEKLNKVQGIAKAFPLEEIATTTLPAKLQMMVTNGFNEKRSGDVFFIMQPQWFSGWKTGTTHGVWNPYDSHIPLLWFGWGVKQGKTNREVYMTDIASTVAALLHIQMPNASIGHVIEEVIK
jgi:predicted AlkP superfamily pyrophosphatase or phosphodiesterase